MSQINDTIYSFTVIDMKKILLKRENEREREKGRRRDIEREEEIRERERCKGYI